MIQLRKKLLFWVWALAIISVSSLLLTRELGLVKGLAISMLVCLALYGELKNCLLNLRWLQNTLVLSAFLFSLLRVLILNTSFLIVLADFLTAFMLLKLVYKKDRKDLLQIVALSFLLLLSASTLALDFTFIFSFALFSLTAAGALCLYTLNEMIEEKGKPKDEDGGTIETKRKREEAQRFYYHLFRNCWLTLGLVVFFAFFIFVFFPRLSIAVFQGTFLGPVHQAGFSEKMSLAKTGTIFEDPAISMRVEIDPESRKRIRQLYLRGQTLSYFDGIEWTADAKKRSKNIEGSYATIRRSGLKIQKVSKNLFHVLDVDKNSLKKEFSMALNSDSYLHQKIYLESLDTPLLFGAPWIESVNVRLPQLTLAQDRSVLRPSNFSGRISYEVRSLIERPNEKILLKKAPNRNEPQDKLSLFLNVFKEEGLPDELSPNLQLPELEFNEVRNLLKGIVSKRDPAYIKTKKIERYLRKNYLYTLKAERNYSKNPMEQFLLESKKGHCEYFASAMTLLLRLEGIPARIVTGFWASEWNPSGNYYLVRNKDAHSWVEAYTSGFWLEFDPSPIVPRAENEKVTFWNWIKKKIDYLNFLWNAYILSYDMESQRDLAKNVELKSTQLSGNLDRIVGEWKIRVRRIQWLGKLRLAQEEENWKEGEGRIRGEIKGDRLKKIILSLLLLLLITTTILGVARYRKKLTYYFNKWIGREVRHLDCHFYIETLKVLSKAGLEKKGSETPYEFLQRVPVTGVSTSQNSKNLYNDLSLLTDLFYKTRFSRIPVTKDELLLIKLSLQDLKKQLK